MFINIVFMEEKEKICIKFYANGYSNAATMQGIVINLGFAISFLILSIYFSLQEKR